MKCTPSSHIFNHSDPCFYIYLITDKLSTTSLYLELQYEGLTEKCKGLYERGWLHEISGCDDHDGLHGVRSDIVYIENLHLRECSLFT